MSDFKNALIQAFTESAEDKQNLTFTLGEVIAIIDRLTKED